MTRRRGIYIWVMLSAVLGLVAVCNGEARASFTIKADSGSPSGNLPYTYGYTATLASGDTLNTGDFFRIYDFQGFDGVVTTPVGWSFSKAYTNPAPPPNVLLQHGDDPGLLNLIWTYTGTSNVISGPVSISGFAAQSVVGTTVTKDFVGRVTATGSSGVYNDSVGSILVPGGGVLPPPVGVPEPTAMISSGLGLVVLGLGYARGIRLRRSR